MPRPSIWKMPFLPTSSSQWKSSTPPNGPLLVWRRCMNCALSPSMNVLPTPSVIQLLYSVWSPDFVSSAAFMVSRAANDNEPIRHAPAASQPALSPCFCQGFGLEVVFIRVPVWLRSLESHRGTDLRAVHRFMTACAPAGALPQTTGMVLSTDNNYSSGRLLLEMTLEAERRVARDQHSLVDRTVRRVARRAPFTQRLVLINERPELHRMALAAGFVFGKQGSPSRLHRRSLVRVVTVRATYLAFEHRMMVRQVELSALVQMTLKAGFRRFARVDDGVARTTRLIVHAAGTVAGLAAGVLGVVPRRLQPG